MTFINLIPKARIAAKRRRLRVRRWLSMGSAYTVALALFAVGARVLWGVDNHALASQLASLSAEIDKSNSAAKSLRQELQHARSVWETHNAVVDQPDWSILLAALAGAIGDEIVLRRCELGPISASVNVPQPAASAGTPSPSVATPTVSLTITGLGRSQMEVSQFVLRLEQLGGIELSSPLFDQVRLVETRREPFHDAEVIAFRVQCTMGSVKKEGK